MQVIQLCIYYSYTILNNTSHPSACPNTPTKNSNRSWFACSSPANDPSPIPERGISFPEKHLDRSGKPTCPTYIRKWKVSRLFWNKDWPGKSTWRKRCGRLREMTWKEGSWPCAFGWDRGIAVIEIIGIGKVDGWVEYMMGKRIINV